MQNDKIHCKDKVKSISFHIMLYRLFSGCHKIQCLRVMLFFSYGPNITSHYGHTDRNMKNSTVRQTKYTVMESYNPENAIFTFCIYIFCIMFVIKYFAQRFLKIKSENYDHIWISIFLSIYFNMSNRNSPLHAVNIPYMKTIHWLNLQKWHNTKSW